MEKFAEYLAAVDGTTGWEGIRPLFDEVFHPDASFVTAEGELNKEQWAEMAKGLTEKGARASGFEVTGEEPETFYYKVTISIGDDEPLHLTSKATVQDGQIVRVEPVDPAAYSAMVERSR